MVRKFKIQDPNGNEFLVNLEKFEWADLYGEKRHEKRSIDGKVLKSVSISSDGAFIIPEKGMTLLNLDTNKRFIANKDIIDVDENGKPIPVLESIFKNGVKLTETITLEDYFCYDISTTYVVQSENDITPLKSAASELYGSKKLFKFKYAYYDTAFPQDAIVIVSEDKLILALGQYIAPVFVGPSTNVQEIFQDVEEEEEEEVSFEQAW